VPSPDVVTQLEQNSMLGEVLASGLRALNSNPRCTEDDLRASHGSTGRAVAHRLERYLNALATIASAAPLLGLLGTVIGMIEIFGSQSPAAVRPAATRRSWRTASRRAVQHGLRPDRRHPALIFWRYFRGRVDDYLLTLELAAERFARHLKLRK
jgi:biopolymer transport protein ExbB